MFICLYLMLLNPALPGLAGSGVQLPVPGCQHCLCIDRAIWMPSLRSSPGDVTMSLIVIGTAPVFSAIRAGLYKRAKRAAGIYLHAGMLRHLSHGLSPHCRRCRHLSALSQDDGGQQNRVAVQ
ncbi:hypothetical protein Hsc_3923 [Herbaspirillum seropedicae]|nr:hypothetical protein Hsc_3923 [Herbaspirillum seropedicae]